MGQKISPTSLRISINKDWRSRWFGTRNYKDYLAEDVMIRDYLSKRLKNMSVDKIDIERSPDVLTIIIHSARPGLIIGRSGAGIDELKKNISRKITRKTAVKVDVQEFKNPELSAAIMAESMAEQLEKRVPRRRVMKQAMTKILANKDVKGVKVAVGGPPSPNGIARTEHLEEGSLPLQTLRADIDYAKGTAFTIWGTLGIKVWIYKGLKF